MVFPVNILFVSHYPHIRMGGQRSMCLLIENLDRDRFRPFSIVPAPGDLSERLKELNCPVNYVPKYGIKTKNIGRLTRRIRRMRRIIIRDDIKIVHPDQDRDALVCGIAKLRTPARMAWHIRITKKRNLDPVNTRLANAFIGVSAAVERRIPPARRHLYRTIYNGVDCDIFSPAEEKEQLRDRLGIPRDRFILIFAGQLKEEKGIFDLVNAVASLEEDTSRKLAVYLIGTYQSEEVERELTEMIDREKLSQTIRIAPQQKNIHEWMQAADALTLPSHEGAEGMGRVIFEAMACGAVVIGTDISGLNEAVTEESGLLVPEKSPEAIAGAIRKLIADRELSTRYSKAGRRRALEHFDIRVHARKVQQLYMDLLEGRLKK